MLRRIKQKRDAQGHAQRAEQQAQGWDALLEMLQKILEALEAREELTHNDQESD